MAFGKYKKGHSASDKEQERQQNMSEEEGNVRQKKAESLEREDLEELFRREMGTDGKEGEKTSGHEPAGKEFFESQAKLEELEKALQNEKDRCLRVMAELENYRRRAARELEEERKYRAMDVIREILPVMDNLGRAVEAAEKQNPDDPLLEGVKMVWQQFEHALENQKCTRIEALNQPFDPNLHQAIQQFESDEVPPNTIIHVAQDGFLLEDRVVRPAQVIVSKAKS
ncbi:MAG: nucleotide exchange factor GrpE [Planctomycetia bacterium]|nr:nucleotide exchange factor GrpE [Planctomycetia bacterium]